MAKRRPKAKVNKSGRIDGVDGVNVLAIDPATKSGWAMLRDGAVCWGTCDASFRRGEESPGTRFRKFRSWLTSMLPGVDVVVYEIVMRHSSTAAAHVYGGIKTVMMMSCDDASVDYEGVPVGTTKKYATGKGNASKADMVKAAKLLFGPAIEDDNEADALMILLTWLDQAGYSPEVVRHG